MQKRYLSIALVVLAVFFLSLFMLSNNVGRYSMTQTSGGGIIILDTVSGEIEGCAAKDSDFENILNCKKVIKLYD